MHVHAYASYGQGTLWAPPVIHAGKLYRGVFRCNSHRILQDINRDNWVVLHCDFSDKKPPRGAPVDMWLFNPIYTESYGDLPHATITGRDLADPTLFLPLHVKRDHDVIMVAGWAKYKRHELLLAAMKYAKEHGRQFSVMVSGYHWQAPAAGTSYDIEATVRREIIKHALPATIVPATTLNRIGQVTVNKRYNACRISLLTSSTEGGGPRAQVEANLADIPHIQTGDTRGGFTRDISEKYGNGILCEPTAKGIVEAVWYCLDNLDKFSPRSWALANACKPVGTAKLIKSLHTLALSRGWYINVDGLNCHPYHYADWHQRVIAADRSLGVT